MKRILFIEDEMFTIQRLREKLEEKYHLDIAEDGNSALSLLNQNKYDFVFLDIMMRHGEGNGIPHYVPAKQTGIEIMKKIRNNETKNSPRVPILVLTAVSDSADLKEIAKYKPVKLFTKPRELKVVYEFIVEAIGNP